MLLIDLNIYISPNGVVVYMIDAIVRRHYNEYRHERQPNEAQNPCHDVHFKAWTYKFGAKL